VPALQPPSWDYPFGTDRQGRDLLAVMVTGTPLTLRMNHWTRVPGLAAMRRWFSKLAAAQALRR